MKVPLFFSVFIFRAARSQGYAAYGNEIKEVPRKKEEERQDIVFPLHKDSILLVEFPFLVMAGKEEAYAIMSSSLTAASQSWITQRLLG